VADFLILLRIAGESPVLILSIVGLIAIILMVVYIILRLVSKAKGWVTAVVGVVTLLMILVLFFLFYWLVMRPYDPSRYGFERPWHDLRGQASETMGWVRSTYTDTQGVVAVAESADRAGRGRYSLKLTTELEGHHPNKSSGEAYAKIAPTNMTTITITALVYAPEGAGGAPNSPNGFQLFVKDQNYKSHYSAWLDIAGLTDKWLELALAPGAKSERDVIDPGFDVTRVVMVGIKIGIGKEVKERIQYRGPVYIDSVDW
jgi:hypothetical protein